MSFEGVVGKCFYCGARVYSHERYYLGEFTSEGHSRGAHAHYLCEHDYSKTYQGPVFHIRGERNLYVNPKKVRFLKAAA